MPAEGIELSPREEILTDDEIIRLARLFVLNGVNKIRLTGGEPSVRKGFPDLIARLAELRPLGLKTIGMTSNGLAIHRKLPQLVANGLTHLNVSLDTLDPFKFEIITRRRGHEAVLSTIETALSLSRSNPDRDPNEPSIKAVKVNVVVVKGLNDMEVLDFVEMTKDKEISVRFIEFMPFTGNKWDKSKIQPADVTLSRIMEKYPGTARLPDEPNLTARDYKVPGYKGSFGLISSMTDHFCGTCNRLRITADGNIKVCLFGTNEVSLRDHMRAGSSDEELLQLIGRAVGNKKARHAGMENIDVVNNRPMILIGG
jgi:cyclic pyranopterin phosphate synthase